MSQSRLVLLPFGRNWSEEIALEQRSLMSQRLNELIVLCGGNLNQTIEGPPNLDLFIKRNSRRISGTETETVVILTRLPLMARAFFARELLERNCTSLCNAIWIIFDLFSGDSVLACELNSMGTLEDEIADFPFWVTAERRLYLIASPEMNDPKRVEFQLSRWNEQASMSR